MDDSSEGDTTETVELLRRVADGDADAQAALFRTCYTDLRARAGALMREQPGHTLQATALVNEAWLRLAGPDGEWESRAHFLNTASRAMRSVLVDHARAKLAAKRGGGARREELLADVALQGEPSWRMLALDEAIDDLEDKHPDLARVAQLRIFGGLSHREIATMMDVTERTIERHWAEARRRLSEVI